MKILLTNAYVFKGKYFKRCSVAVHDGMIYDISGNLSSAGFDLIFDFSDFYIFPGFADAHVHLREPGFSYKETIKTGTLAAARGGFTAVCAMPNLKPPPDRIENLKAEHTIIKNDAAVSVYPYAAITENRLGHGKLTDFGALSPLAVAFSDDGCGVQDETLMLKAMTAASAAGRIIAAHCEDESLLCGGYIHDGEYAKQNGHKGISSESEYKQLERDIRLAKITGCSYHVCHVSAKESVELVRRAKADGVDITCETAPHYIALCDADLKDDGRFKMNPPLRSAADREALLRGIADGTVDMIATDHAPHSREEKSKGLKDSLMGVTGLETAFAVCYTKLVKSGPISLERLIALMSLNPRKRFKLQESRIEIGQPADFTVFDLNTLYAIDSGNFLSKGKSTPFDGMRVFGRPILTYTNGRIAWIDEEIKK